MGAILAIASLLLILAIALAAGAIISYIGGKSKPEPEVKEKKGYLHLADPEVRSEYVIKKIKRRLPSSPLGYVWILRSYLQGVEKELYIGLFMMNAVTGEEKLVTKINISVIDRFPLTGQPNVPITEDFLIAAPWVLGEFFDESIPKFFRSAAVLEASRIKNEAFAENFVERTEIVGWENEDERRQYL